MEEFLAKFQDQVLGVLEGFDRLVLGGSPWAVAYVAVMNRRLRALFGPDPDDRAERRRGSANVSGLLRLPRAHKLIRKLPSTRRCKVTLRGQELAAAVATARRLSLRQIHRAVA